MCFITLLDNSLLDFTDSFSYLHVEIIPLFKSTLNSPIVNELGMLLLLSKSSFLKLNNNFFSSSNSI